AGALALVTTALTFPEPGAPQALWLLVLAFEALARSIPGERARLVMRVLRGASLVALVVVLAPFAVDQVRHALPPVLDTNEGTTPVHEASVVAQAPKAPGAGLLGALNGEADERALGAAGLKEAAEPKPSSSAERREPLVDP